MKKALIDTRDNTIVQVDVVEFPVGDPYVWVDCQDEVEAYQWTYDGNTFAPPPPPPPLPAPTIVSMRQARLALLAEGHLATVNAAMSTQQEAAQIEWEYATEVRRDSPLTAAMGALLGLSDAQMDALFLAASAL